MPAPTIRRTYEPLAWFFDIQFTLIPMRVSRGTPWKSKTITWESDPPFRVAPTTVFKFGPLPFGIGVGVWQESDVDNLQNEFQRSVAEATLKSEYDRYVAFNGEVDYDEWLTARHIVADSGLDPDDDLEIQIALGAVQ